MKYYSLEMVSNTLNCKVRIFNNSIEELSATISVSLLAGYCRCLEDFGYVPGHTLKMDGDQTW